MATYRVTYPMFKHATPTVHPKLSAPEVKFYHRVDFAQRFAAKMQARWADWPEMRRIAPPVTVERIR